MSWASVVFLWGLFSVCLQRYFDILFYIFLINMRGSSSRQVCCLRCLAASGPGTELQSLVSNSRERYGQRQPATGLKLICFVERRSGDVIDDNIGQYYIDDMNIEYSLDALPQVHHRSDRGGDRGHSGELLYFEVRTLMWSILTYTCSRSSIKDISDDSILW